MGLTLMRGSTSPDAFISTVQVSFDPCSSMQKTMGGGPSFADEESVHLRGVLGVSSGSE